MQNIFSMIVHRAWPVLILLAVITVGFVSQLPKIKMETNVENMLPHSMDAYANKLDSKTSFLPPTWW